MPNATKDNVVYGILLPSVLVNMPQQLGLFSLDNAQSILMAFVIGGAGFAGKHATQWAIDCIRKNKDPKK